ncbi:MAG: oligopeptidase [Subtercola sp.]|nr:oligopeptidase [Subtercola sp.]
MSDDRFGDDGFGDDDRFRDWDAAYVLGSLSSAERLEYEQHLSQCPRCSAAVAELAGLPGLLGTLPADEAFALDRASTSADAPPSILPALLSAARTSRRRSRLIAFSVGVGSVAAAAALALIVTFAVTPAAPAGPPVPTAQPGDTSLVSELQFVPEAPSPLSAVGTLRDEPWGTRIEWTCTYAYATTQPAVAGTGGYALIVTDRAGASVQVATWTSAPGTVASPTATTSIRRADIASVTIVAGDTGQVLLSSTL